MCCCPSPYFSLSSLSPRRSSRLPGIGRDRDLQERGQRGVGDSLSLLEPTCTRCAEGVSQKARFHALQGVRKGKVDQSRYHGLMRKLLADVKRRAVSGQLLSSSVAGHLLNVRYITALNICFGRPAAPLRLASACPSPLQPELPGKSLKCQYILTEREGDL